MLDSQAFCTFAGGQGSTGSGTPGAASGAEFPRGSWLWECSDVPPPPPPRQLPALCRPRDAPAAPGSWKPRMRTCVLGLIPPQSFLLPFL